MKQVLALNIAIISAEETMILRHPSTIYTNDDIEVTLCSDEAELNYEIARLETAPSLPDIGEWCEKDRVYDYGEYLAKCIQGHYRMHYPLEQTPALFNIIPKIEEDEYPVFVAPTGSHDVYMKDDIVWFPELDTTLYISLIDNNSWSPTEYAAGWSVYEEDGGTTDPVEPTVEEWAAGVAYTTGDVVTYEGLEYECRQSHTSLTGWEPPNVLALWLPL